MRFSRIFSLSPVVGYNMDFFEEFLMFPASGKGFVTGSVEGFPGRERCLPRVRRAENGLYAGFLRS